MPLAHVPPPPCAARESQPPCSDAIDALQARVEQLERCVDATLPGRGADILTAFLPAEDTDTHVPTRTKTVANMQLRTDPLIPKMSHSPWGNSSYDANPNAFERGWDVDSSRGSRRGLRLENLRPPPPPPSGEATGTQALARALAAALEGAGRARTPESQARELELERRVAELERASELERARGGGGLWKLWGWRGCSAAPRDPPAAPLDPPAAPTDIALEKLEALGERLDAIEARASELSARQGRLEARVNGIESRVRSAASMAPAAGFDVDLHGAAVDTSFIALREGVPPPWIPTQPPLWTPSVDEESASTGALSFSAWSTPSDEDRASPSPDFLREYTHPAILPFTQIHAPGHSARIHALRLDPAAESSDEGDYSYADSQDEEIDGGENYEEVGEEIDGHGNYEEVGLGPAAEGPVQEEIDGHGNYEEVGEEIDGHGNYEEVGLGAAAAEPAQGEIGAAVEPEEEIDGGENYMAAQEEIDGHGNYEEVGLGAAVESEEIGAQEEIGAAVESEEEIESSDDEAWRRRIDPRGTGTYDESGALMYPRCESSESEEEDTSWSYPHFHN